MTPCRVFLTGEPGCGKTTAIKNTYEILKMNMKVGGIISGEIREGGVRVGFNLEDLMTHEKGVLAHVNQREGPRVGKYRINLIDVQRVAVKAIDLATAGCDAVIIDELGPMELHSTPFVSAVEAALETPKKVLGTIHKHATHPLVATIKKNPSYQIVEVTSENRDSIPRMLVERVEQ